MLVRKRAGLASCGLLWALGVPASAGAADWPVLDASDLAMTAEPKAPLAPAVYLYRQVDRDDESGYEDNLFAIKVLTEEGRKYADVVITYPPTQSSVSGIEARVIRPDGTIVRFDGKIYESALVKLHGKRVMSKSFTLPDVQVGSVIEYKLRRRMADRYVYDSNWLLNDDLFTRRALFTLRKNPHLAIIWSWPLGLPPGASTPESKGPMVSMTATDIPAFVTEEYMPPESALKYRVEFSYQYDNPDKDAPTYWKRISHDEWRRVDDFVDHRRAMEKALATIIDPADSPDVRLQKIYMRVQRLRNLSFEPSRSEKEAEREKLRESDDAADVWERGYGAGDQVTWLFVALARAAGLQVDVVRVASRDDSFFNPDMRRGWELNTTVARVKIGEREIWADPGTKFAPLGVLPWYETGATGFVIGKDGGTWVRTPMPDEQVSRLERHATLTLSPDGTLQGKLTVSYHGLQALTRRVSMRNEDERTRREALENEVKSYVPVGVEATMVSAPDWEASNGVLRAEFDISVPGWANHAGSRLLVPDAVFRAHEKGMFAHAERVHPIYFDYPHSYYDDVTMTLPPGYEPASLPVPSSADAGAAKYNNVVTFADGALRARRHVEIAGVLFPPSAAPADRKSVV